MPVARHVDEDSTQTYARRRNAAIGIMLGALSLPNMFVSKQRDSKKMPLLRLTVLFRIIVASRHAIPIQIVLEMRDYC
jgi:hypothetical protein